MTETIEQQAERFGFLGEPQPPPTPSDGVPVTELLQRLFPRWQQERAAAGLKKYGVLLQANNGRDALADAMQELLDAPLYVLQAAIEREQDKELIFHLEERVSQAEHSRKIAWKEVEDLRRENKALKARLEGTP